VDLFATTLGTYKLVHFVYLFATTLGTYKLVHFVYLYVPRLVALKLVHFVYLYVPRLVALKLVHFVYMLPSLGTYKLHASMDCVCAGSPGCNYVRTVMSLVVLLAVRYGEDLVFEQEVTVGTTFQFDTAAVATYLGIPPRCIAYHSSGVELEKNGTGFVTPPVWLRLTASNGPVPVTVGAFLTEEGLNPQAWYDTDDEMQDDENEKEVQLDDADIEFEDVAMQGRYNYLKHRTYPPGLEHAGEKNFRRECKRSYSLSSEGYLMFHGNVRRPTRTKKHRAELSPPCTRRRGK
jgi:hypothetical protein